MTAQPPLDPRLTMLAGRLARLSDLSSEAAQVTAGLVSIAGELQMLPRLSSEDLPVLPISTAFWATSQSVNELISAGARLLEDIQQERQRRATANNIGEHGPVELEPHPKAAR